MPVCLYVCMSICTVYICMFMCAKCYIVRDRERNINAYMSFYQMLHAALFEGNNYVSFRKA